jgi:competence protein ComEC
MDILFFLLSLLCLVALVIGIIKPKVVIRWGSPAKKNRKNVLKVYGIGFILFFSLFSASIKPMDAYVDEESSNPIENEVQLGENEQDNELETDNETVVGNEAKEPNSQVNKSNTTNDTGVEGNLEVHFIDVGQADSILIIEGDDTMLIDAGNNDDSKLVVNYIKSLGISDIDYVIGTHPHEDHIGGLDAVINSFDIGKVIMPKEQSNTKTFEDVLVAIKNKGLKITSPVVGNTYNLGEAEWTILAPSQDKNEDINNASIAIRLVYGNKSFMFTGAVRKQHA